MNPMLPGLHQAVLATARRRRKMRHRRIVVLAVLATLLAAGGAVAATGLLGEVDEGDVGATHYRITATMRGDLLCLRVVWSHQLPAVRCDPPPAGNMPFGPILRTVAPDGHGQLLAAIVRRDVAQVKLLADGRVVKTARHVGISGRVLSVKGRFRRVWLEAETASGASLGRVGDEASNRAPSSHDEARAQGDPAAFAPTATQPPLRLHGRVITTEEATRSHLHCISDTGQCLTKADVKQLCAQNSRPALRRLFCVTRERPRR